MTAPATARILDWVVEDHIPADLDLNTRITRVARSPARRPAHKPIPLAFKLAVSLVVALAALLLFSTVVYAVYRLLLSDPGLQAVQQAGLVQTVAVTAQPTVLPTDTPHIPSPSIRWVGQSQTLEGVTMTLAWVYLDARHCLLGLHFSALPPGVSVDFPEVKVAGERLGHTNPSRPDPPSRFLRMGAEEAIFASYQLIHIINGKPAPIDAVITLPLEVSVPLVWDGRSGVQPAVVFHFALPDVPLYPGSTVSLQQSYSASVNGVQLDLHSLRITSTQAEAVVCRAAHLPEANSPPVSLANATFVLQPFVNGQPQDPQRQHLSIQTLAEPDVGCQRVRFDAQGLPTDQSLALTFNREWRFLIDQPLESRLPGLPAPLPASTPTPVVVQSIADVKVALDWVFADARRLSFGYTISGFPELPKAFSLGGKVKVIFAQSGGAGQEVAGSSRLQRGASPGVIQGTWSVVLPEPLAPGGASLKIDVTLDGTHGNDPQYTIGWVYPTDKPEEELARLQPASIPPALLVHNLER